MCSRVSPPSGPGSVFMVSSIRCVPHRLEYAVDVSGGKNHVLPAGGKGTNPIAKAVIDKNGQIPLREPRQVAGSHHAG